jgi:hypothetical protein
MVALVAAVRLEALMEALVVLETHQAQAQAKEIMAALGLAQQAMELAVAVVLVLLAQMPQVILGVMVVLVQHLL